MHRAGPAAPELVHGEVLELGAADDRVVADDDAVAAVEELREINEGNKEIYEIVINADDIELDFTQSQVSMLADKLKSVFQNFERGASAVVADKDFIFGMCRMLQAMIVNDRIVVAAFRTEKLAREWIREIRTLHKSAHPDA